MFLRPPRDKTTPPGCRSIPPAQLAFLHLLLAMSPSPSRCHPERSEGPQHRANIRCGPEGISGTNPAQPAPVFPRCLSLALLPLRAFALVVRCQPEQRAEPSRRPNIRSGHGFPPPPAWSGADPGGGWPITVGLEISAAGVSGRTVPGISCSGPRNPTLSLYHCRPWFWNSPHLSTPPDSFTPAGASRQKANLSAGITRKPDAF